MLIAVLWIGWCTMHSLLIDATVTGFIKTRLPEVDRYYRLLYNGLSLMTLFPLAVYTRGLGGQVVFAWQGWCGLLLRAIFFAIALLLFFSGAKRYNLEIFLGINQLRRGNASLLLSTAVEFPASGVFALTRHPWYFGSFIAIWTVFAVYPYPVFMASIILSAYLVVGTFLEERKIVREYGDSYRRYQQQVSMLFPWKWLKSRMKL